MELEDPSQMIDKVLNTPLINLFKDNEKNNSVIVRINQTISKLLTMSKFLQLKCLQIEQLLANWYNLILRLCH